MTRHFLALLGLFALTSCSKPHISTPLSAFQKDQYNDWHATIPQSCGQFMGKQVGIVISPMRLSETEPAPEGIRLLQKILAQYEEVLRVSEQKLREYESSTDRDFVTHIKNPHVWIMLDPEDPQEWAFVVERDDWPSFGWHIEFHNLQFKEIWAGD